MFDSIREDFGPAMFQLAVILYDDLLEKVSFILIPIFDQLMHHFDVQTVLELYENECLFSHLTYSIYFWAYYSF